MRLRHLVAVVCSLSLVSCAAPSSATQGKPGSGLKVAAPMTPPAATVGVQEASLRTPDRTVRFVGAKPGWGVRVARADD